MIEACFFCPSLNQEVGYDIKSVKSWAENQLETLRVEYRHTDFDYGVTVPIPLYVKYLKDSTEKQILDYLVFVIRDKTKNLPKLLERIL